MSHVVICLGLSGSGKTTLSDILTTDPNWFGLHPIEGMKRYYESHFGYPVGYLDTVEGKAAFVPGTTITNQDWLVDMFHFWQERVPHFTSFYIKNKLPEILESRDNSVFIQGVRNVTELETILNVVQNICVKNDIKRSYDDRITMLNLVRDNGSTEYSSDKKLTDLIKILVNKGYDVKTVLNNGTIDGLIKVAESLK